MPRKMKSLVLPALAAALCVSTPAQAAMACWNETQVAAVQVRDLQSRLMVAALRCAAMGEDVTPAYNRFVVANRETIQRANGVILAAFRSGVDGQAQEAYDRFATALANQYGDDDTNAGLCADAALAAGEAAAAHGDVDRLLALAERLGEAPAVPGGRCGITFAALEVR